MTTLRSGASELREECDRARAAGKRVGLVPTMGGLHSGHLSLIAEARDRGCDHLVLTIFVNPLQFGPHEDFERYPRTLENDLELCRAAGVHTVFAPPQAEMYPSGFETHVEVERLTTMLEGAHRPGHFRGVATVVAKLFGLAGACTAVFGRKDYQQWRVLERMTRDLMLPVEVVGAPVIREPDGLALSSRNRYLDPTQRAKATAIVNGLRASWSSFQDGQRDANDLANLTRLPIAAAFDSIDYVAIADPETLAPIEGQMTGDRALVAVAARIGSTRLIDNVVLGSDPRP